jgi:hypothetical protein
MRNCRQTAGRAGSAFLGVLLAAGPAAAHALHADCTRQGNRVEVEAYFSDNTSARHATVRVLDARKELVAEGRTDRDGHWSFPTPQPGRYVAIVDAGAGHLTRVPFIVPARNPNTTITGPPTIPERLNEGASRAEVTAFPWTRVGFGLGVIAGAGFLAWGMRHRRRTAANSSTPAE